jgi:tetratricopeptide (TPR) repeat protein
LGGEASLTPDAQPTLPPTAEPTLAPTATLEPTLAPTQEAVQPTLAPTQIVAVEPTTPPAAAVVNDVATRPRNARMTGFVYQKQTWNNCGPSNITMALSYYGWRQDQAFAAQFLKPGGREDKNVSPSEMVAFVNEQSAVRALYRIGGTVELIKTLLANNFPVIIETGFMPEGYDWIGHYRTLSGYDENQGVFYVYDSFLGQVNGDPIPDSFTVMDSMWRHFNRTFIVVYEPQREALLQELLGDYWEVEKAAQIALETATAEARADSTDGHAWFNLGSSLARLGDFERAALAYDRARVEGVPWRMTWYQFEPFEAYYGAGRYNEVISLAEANIANGAQYVEETYYWQGRALQALGRTTEAGTAYRNALRRNPSYDAAQTALNALGS